jgi:ParB family chromosome partitioning protein
VIEVSKAFEPMEIEVGRLKPNPWNPNRMSDEMYHKLKAYIKREGLVEPIVVRPNGDGYQILGGYHRWRIATDLGYETVPCAVVDLDDRRAKILSVNLNEMKGQSVSSLLSELVHDLSQELTLEDLESQLPYTEADLKDTLELMKIPDGLEGMLDDEVEKAERERPHILSFVVEDVETVERAIESASQRNGGLTRGKALVEIAGAYISEVVSGE